MTTTNELTDFVRGALIERRTRAEIGAVLRQAGWTVEQVGAALNAFAPIEFPLPVPRPRPSLSSREAFTYLLMFTALYVVAFQLGNLLFDLINLALPDPATALPQGYTNISIRWSVSSLVVASPVFLFMSHLTARAVREDPNKRTSPTRRWLTYLTLFVAACVLIGDSVYLVYSFLGGELTTRFVLKVLVVAVIAGTSFWYYLSDLRLDEKELEL